MEHASGHIWDNILSFRHYREVGIAVVAAGILVAGYYAYDGYANNREAQANQVFAESYDLFQAAINADEKDVTKKQMLLEEAETAFKTGYTKFSNTRLAPYFLGLEAEVALKRENPKSAIELMNRMLALMSKSSPLYGLYATKLALIKMDQPDMAQDGLRELAALAHDARNDAQDFALYVLGEYYWEQGDTAKATETWRELRDLGQRGSRPIASPWLSLVQQRLTA